MSDCRECSQGHRTEEVPLKLIKYHKARYMNYGFSSLVKTLSVHCFSSFRCHLRNYLCNESKLGMKAREGQADSDENVPFDTISARVLLAFKRP